MDELQDAIPGAAPATGNQHLSRLVVLLVLVVTYCLVPIGSLAAALWSIFYGSANYFIENGDFVALVTWLATEPTSSVGLLQQLIAPVAAAVTGASLASLNRSHFVSIVVGICCLAIVCALVTSTLFQLRSVLTDPGTLGAIQTYFHGLANTLGVYVLFLLGISGVVQAKSDAEEAE